MRNAITIALCAGILVHGNACFLGGVSSARIARSWIDEGMSKQEVIRTIGNPVRVIPIPGQGDDPRLVVEDWRYAYETSTLLIVIMYFTFFGLFLLNYDPYHFDVGFGRDGRVKRTSEVLIGK